MEHFYPYKFRSRKNCDIWEKNILNSFSFFATLIYFLMQAMFKMVPLWIPKYQKLISIVKFLFLHKKQQFLHSPHPSSLTYPVCPSPLHSFLLAPRLSHIYSFDPNGPLFKNALTINKDALSPSLCNSLPLSTHPSIQPSAHVCAELIQPLKGNGNLP